MVPICQFRHLMSQWEAPVFTVVSVLLLSASDISAQVACPADDFSENIESLLRQVEGPDFSSASNLDSWNQRRGTIQSSFGEIVELASNDVGRRKATIEALLAAESLAVEPSEATRLIGRTRGEVRAWIRRVLAGYYSMGITPEDRKLISASFITDLQGSWDDTQAEHPQRNLPLYQEKAAALRGRAKYYQSASCDKET